MNNDGKPDFIITYDLRNCVRGNGTTSDFLILKSVNDDFIFDSKLANKIKGGLWDYVRANFQSDEYVSHKNNYYETKNLIVNFANNKIIKGEFMLKGEGPTCCPDFHGTFKFNINLNQFNVVTLVNQN